MNWIRRTYLPYSPLPYDRLRASKLQYVASCCSSKNHLVTLLSASYARRIYWRSGFGSKGLASVVAIQVKTPLALKNHQWSPSEILRDHVIVCVCCEAWQIFRYKNPPRSHQPSVSFLLLFIEPKGQHTSISASIDR